MIATAAAETPASPGAAACTACVAVAAAPRGITWATANLNEAAQPHLYPGRQAAPGPHRPGGCVPARCTQQPRTGGLKAACWATAQAGQQLQARLPRGRARRRWPAMGRTAPPAPRGAEPCNACSQLGLHHTCKLQTDEGQLAGASGWMWVWGMWVWVYVCVCTGADGAGPAHNTARQMGGMFLAIAHQ